MAERFVHLHVHSHYSLLSGASGLQEILARARAWGAEALALTDTNGLYGAMPFYKMAREAGIKPILGAVIEERRKEETNGPVPSAVCLVRNHEGYTNLCRLITARHLDEGFDLAGALVRYRHGLIILSASIPLLRVLAGKIERGSLYVELRRFSHPRVGAGGRSCGPGDLAPPECGAQPFDVAHSIKTQGREQRRTAQGGEPVEPQAAPLREIHQRDIQKFAREMGLPVVATNAVHFVERTQHPTHRVLTAIRKNMLERDLPPEDVAHPEAWLKPPSDMEGLFADMPEAVRNTRRIAAQCNLTLQTGKPIFPHYTLPEGETPYSYLCKLAFEGAVERYRPLSEAVMKRLEYELRVIHTLGFAEYFVIVWDIVNFARRKGIPIAGRGSAADSLVAYCLGITIVDPLRYDLYFERFLNLSRTDCPDIDLDMCWRRRDEVLKYVYHRYGADRVAMIANHNTYQARSAFRDVARVYGLPLDEISRLSAMLPYYNVKSIRDAMRWWPETRGFPIDTEPYKSIIAMAETMDGFPRHLSIHVGGIVIGDQPLTHYLPLERATKGLVITQYDMGPVEELGLVKIDLLGQRSLSIISDVVDAVQKNYGEKIVPDQIEDGDPKTADLIRTGRTIGCFQIESPGMRNLLQMMQATTRQDLIIALSLIRPGPSGSGMKERFVMRRTGREKPVYLHQSLRRVLGDTYGVMLYQEDILKVAEAVAGFTLEEGDQLRKAISKKRSPERLARLREKFVSGATANGARPDAAEELWGLISNFASYSYCKAHATTYGHISYQAVYLKAHYPAEFLAAVMSNLAGFYETREYLEEARRLGVRILPPDVNRSGFFHLAADNALRVGLMQVKGLSRNAIRSIIHARHERPFESLPDLRNRTNVTRPEAESLILCGAMGGLDATRPEMLWQLRLLSKEKRGTSARPRCDLLFAKAQSSTNSSNLLRQAFLFAKGQSSAKISNLVGQAFLPAGESDYSREKKIELEQEILDLTVSDHPLALYEKELSGRRFVPADRLAEYAGRRVTVAGWLVTMRRAVTKNHDYMKFLTIEDLSGTMEIVLFPDTYQKFGHLISSYGPYVVRGRVECPHHAVTITAEWIDVVAPHDRG